MSTLVNRPTGDAQTPHAGLFTPLRVGSGLSLSNRLAVAPMTRVSATADGHATKQMADYYEAFAAGGFGLVITEGIYTDNAHAQGYLFQPGLADDAQRDAWRTAVDRVHAHGGRVVAQLMHAGALSQGNAHRITTKGPSAVLPAGQQMAFYRGEGPYRIPEAMSADDISEAVEGFAQAARRAQEAGFDGVEVHGANGYLLDQFLTAHTNLREDCYGGSLANRLRLTSSKPCDGRREGALLWGCAPRKARSTTSRTSGRAARPMRHRSSARSVRSPSITFTRPSSRPGVPRSVSTAPVLQRWRGGTFRCRCWRTVRCMRRRRPTGWWQGMRRTGFRLAEVRSCMPTGRQDCAPERCMRPSIEGCWRRSLTSPMRSVTARSFISLLGARRRWIAEDASKGLGLTRVHQSLIRRLLYAVRIGRYGTQEPSTTAGQLF